VPPKIGRIANPTYTAPSDMLVYHGDSQITNLKLPTGATRSPPKPTVKTGGQVNRGLPTVFTSSGYLWIKGRKAPLIGYANWMASV